MEHHSILCPIRFHVMLFFDYSRGDFDVKETFTKIGFILSVLVSFTHVAKLTMGWKCGSFLKDSRTILEPRSKLASAFSLLFSRTEEDFHSSMALLCLAILVRNSVSGEARAVGATSKVRV